MALESLDLLDKFKGTGPSAGPQAAKVFTPGYPVDQRTFYAPVDDVAGVLRAVLTSFTHSFVFQMFGYDDPELNTILKGKADASDFYLQMTLDSTQAAGAAEKAILATWANDKAGNSIAIGRSERGAILHMKLGVGDGIDVVTGSTNWSVGGETKQANQLTIIRSPIVAAEARARLDLLHDFVLKQMAAKA